MSLPVIVAPEFTVQLHSIKAPVVFRPYLAKEEKILLMAQQSEDPQDVDRAVKQVLRNCTFDRIDMNALPSFDLELLYLQIRSKSVSNKVEVRFECKNAVAGSPAADGLCHEFVTIAVDLDEVKIETPEGHTPVVWLTDDIGVTLRYPAGEFQAQLLERTNNDAVGIIAMCLETIFEKDGTVHEVREQSVGEVRTFIESLSVAQMDKIRQFFDTMPQLTHTIAFACPKCGYTEDITLRGLLDFFD